MKATASASIQSRAATSNEQSKTRSAPPWRFEPMYVLYSLLLTFGFILLSPRFVIDAFRRGKYVTGLPERLGKLPPIETARPVIWLHCVSVGETRAAQTLVRGLLHQFPTHSLVVSTTTVTGQKLARDIFAADATSVFY